MHEMGVVDITHHERVNDARKRDDALGGV